MNNTLSLWESNPRAIDKTDFDRAKRQMQETKEITGQWLYKPLVITPDGEVLGGNMRLRVLQDLGVKDIWVSVVNAKTEADKLKIALSDNDRWGYYIEQDLAQLLENNKLEINLEDYKIDLGKPIDLQTLLDRFGPEVEEDEPPPLPEEAISKYGEVYELGRHRLMCGDATKIEDVEKLMGGKKADMVFTDPPYNVDYGVSKNPKHKYRTIEGDKQSPEEWEQFNKEWIANMITVSKGQADTYVWGAPGPEGMKQRLWLVDLGYHWSATIIWKKQQLILTPAKYQRMYEPCFYGWRDLSSYQGSRTETEVWDIDRPHNSEQHPTMKPLALCAKGIKNSSKQDDIILDLFGGSGSTLIAAEQTNRVCYMMEIDPKYCDVIRTRYNNFINKEGVVNERGKQGNNN